jgi:hypothetical protein
MNYCWTREGVPGCSKVEQVEQEAFRGSERVAIEMSWPATGVGELHVTAATTFLSRLARRRYT